MSGPFVPGVGAVFSADIAVPDHERELRFYARVLSTGLHPLWREQDLMNNLGIPVIGLGARGPEHARLPLQWMPHIQVADVGASVRRAVGFGAEVLMHAGDEASSRWAVLLDPNGAAFGLIPVVEEHVPPSAPAAAEAVPAVGRIAWLDLTVPDAALVRDFYGPVVGWSAQDVVMNDGNAQYVDHVMLGQSGTAAAGICHARGPNADLPPVWLIYLPVGDLAESVRRVAEEGGQVLGTVRGEAAHGYAVIQDPVGAYFAVLQA